MKTTEEKNLEIGTWPTNVYEKTLLYIQENFSYNVMQMQVICQIFLMEYNHFMEICETNHNNNIIKS